MEYHNQFRLFINARCNEDSELAQFCCSGNYKMVQRVLSENPNIDISAKDNCALKKTCDEYNKGTYYLFGKKHDMNSYLHIAMFLCRLKPFKYRIAIKMHKLKITAINTNRVENILFILYAMCKKGYKTNLLSEIAEKIAKL